MMVGQYKTTIDIRRRRIRIPAVFHKQMGDNAIFIEKKYQKKCLDILPQKVFEKNLVEMQSILDPYNKDHSLLLQAFLSSFVRVEGNKQEIYLRKDFFDHLEIEDTNQLVVIGMGSFIRIYAYNSSEEITKEEYLELLRKAQEQKIKSAYN